MNQNRQKEFDPAIADIFHAMVKKGGKLIMHNGHVAGPRPHIHHTVMPLRGHWKLPKELCQVISNSRSLELD